MSSPWKQYLLVAVVMLGCAGRASTAVAAGLPTCATGRASKADAASPRQLVATERRAFTTGLSDVTATSARNAGDVFAAGVAAYLYGYPDVLLRRTVASYPRNQMISIAALTDPSTKTVVAPNHDTLYSVGQLDLTDGPLVIQTPPTGGRYSVIQLLDTFTNAFAYLGDGAGATKGETVALVPPGWHGALPTGVRELRSPSKTVWLLGRTLADDQPDVAAARRLMARYAVTALQDYVAGTRKQSLVLDAFPAAGHKAVQVPTGPAFFDELGGALATDPAPARDACALRAFRSAGIGPGLTPSVSATGLQARALRAAAAAGPRVLSHVVIASRTDPKRLSNGWTITPEDTARFGTDYLTRAVIARIGLGANTVEQALYPSTSTDSRRRTLTGDHTYRVRFAPGQLPPVGQFWSLTLYTSALQLFANPLGRYAIGDRTSGLRHDRDGGLTITVSHTTPPAGKRANWLPAPAGRFSLYLRLYEPKASAATGRWRPPAVERLR